MAEQVINTRTALLAASANSAIQDVRAPGTRSWTQAQDLSGASMAGCRRTVHFPAGWPWTVPLPSLNLLGFRSANGLRRRRWRAEQLPRLPASGGFCRLAELDGRRGQPDRQPGRGLAVMYAFQDFIRLGLA